MVGERLAEIRKDHDDTQAALAKKLNVSVTTVRSWEQEKSSPSHDALVAICRLYRISADYLLGLSEVVSNDLPVERHLGSDDVGAHCGLGLRQQTERERDAAGDGKQDAQKSFVDGRHNILLSVL